MLYIGVQLFCNRFEDLVFYMPQISDRVLIMKIARMYIMMKATLLEDNLLSFPFKSSH